jgi:hypothetical protein
MASIIKPNDLNVEIELKNVGKASSKLKDIGFDSNVSLNIEKTSEKTKEAAAVKITDVTEKHAKVHTSKKAKILYTDVTDSKDKLEKLPEKLVDENPLDINISVVNNLYGQMNLYLLNILNCYKNWDYYKGYEKERDKEIEKNLNAAERVIPAISQKLAYLFKQHKLKTNDIALLSSCLEHLNEGLSLDVIAQSINDHLLEVLNIQEIKKYAQLPDDLGKKEFIDRLINNSGNFVFQLSNKLQNLVTDFPEDNKLDPPKTEESLNNAYTALNWINEQYNTICKIPILSISQDFQKNVQALQSSIQEYEFFLNSQADDDKQTNCQASLALAKASLALIRLSTSSIHCIEDKKQLIENLEIYNNKSSKMAHVLDSAEEKIAKFADGLGTIAKGSLLSNGLVGNITKNINDFTVQLKAIKEAIENNSKELTDIQKTLRTNITNASKQAASLFHIKVHDGQDQLFAQRVNDEALLLHANLINVSKTVGIYVIPSLTISLAEAYAKNRIGDEGKRNYTKFLLLNEGFSSLNAGKIVKNVENKEIVQDINWGGLDKKELVEIGKTVLNNKTWDTPDMGSMKPLDKYSKIKPLLSLTSNIDKALSEGSSGLGKIDKEIDALLRKQEANSEERKNTIGNYVKLAIQYPKLLIQAIQEKRISLQNDPNSSNVVSNLISIENQLKSIEKDNLYLALLFYQQEVADKSLKDQKDYLNKIVDVLYELDKEYYLDSDFYPFYSKYPRYLYDKWTGLKGYFTDTTAQINSDKRYYREYVLKNHLPLIALASVGMDEAFQSFCSEECVNEPYQNLAVERALMMAIVDAVKTKKTITVQGNTYLKQALNSSGNNEINAILDEFYKSIENDETIKFTQEISEAEESD